jgi:hypothetical protein
MVGARRGLHQAPVPRWGTAANTDGGWYEMANGGVGAELDDRTRRRQPGTRILHHRALRAFLGVFVYDDAPGLDAFAVSQ